MIYRKAEFIPYRPKTILNTHKHPDHWFWTRYTAYPYIGCQHGCEFCYCRESKYAPYDELDDFPYKIKIKENAPALFRKALSKVPTGLVAVGDYQPVEKKYMFSRKMLEICLELGFPVFVLERSPLVLRDLDLLLDINKKTHATVVFSIIHTAGSTHADKISRMERLSPPPSKRYEAMEKLAAAGIRTGVSFMPILPGLCDTEENLRLVIQKTADHGGKFILAAPLTLADQQKAYVFGYLEKNHPELLESYRRIYPPKSYGPKWDTWLKTGRCVREICAEVGIPDRMLRPLIPGEKREANKRAAEMLADETYTLELEGASQARMWAYRKAAWAVEEFGQDIRLVYNQLGLRGLQNIRGVGTSTGARIESFLTKEGLVEKPFSHESA